MVLGFGSAKIDTLEVDQSKDPGARIYATKDDYFNVSFRDAALQKVLTTDWSRLSNNQLSHVLGIIEASLKQG